MLKRIDGERMEHDVLSAMQASAGDRDAAYRCRDRLLDLPSAIDEAEDLMEWPSLVAEAAKEVEVERSILDSPNFDSTPEEHMAFETMRQDIEAAKREHDKELLRAKIDEMDRLGRVICHRTPGWWVAAFRDLDGKKGTMRDAQQAESLLTQGHRTLRSGDLDELRRTATALAELLPSTDPDRNRFYEASLIR